MYPTPQGQSCLFQPSSLARRRRRRRRTSHKVWARCKYPAWALNRIKLKIKAPVPNNNKRSTNISGSNTARNHRPYMVVPYTKGLSESLRKVCSKHGVQVYFKEARPSEASQWFQRIKIPSSRKVKSYTDINVTGWTVMKNILESLQEHLERDSMNTKWPPLQYMTIPTPLVTLPL